MKKLIEKVQEDCVVFALFSALCFLIGLIIGFLASPIKSGVTIASNNTIISNDDEDEDEE